MSTPAPLPPLPFDDSRRLTGPNLYFAQACALLETLAETSLDEARVARWRERVDFAQALLDWPATPVAVRRRAAGGALAIAAPPDQLFVATEVNEWAWLGACADGDRTRIPALFHAPAFPAIWDDDLALHTLRAASAAERHPELRVIEALARQHGVPLILDDETLTLGEGDGAANFALHALPAADAIAWPSLHAIPVALVTGSNGKTTTTRLVAAMCEAHGWRTAYSCTDGVFIGSEALAGGDYSGPAGARQVLREPRAQAAVLETARGGILRRGLAVDHAQAAIVTNISADHFGEYGIGDLDDLAETKLVVARGLAPQGVLVLNADDAALVRHLGTLDVRVAWFALDADAPRLVAHRAAGGATCGMRDGVLMLHARGVDHALGRVVDLPLTAGGSAAYNIANLAGACLVADALGIAAEVIASVAARFGADNADNPGRLMRWSFGTLTVLLDYAHNPAGLQGLLQVARAAAPSGRLALVLGQAGNRLDADVRALAHTAATTQPDLVVLKDIESFLRGREPGEIASILRAALIEGGVPASHIVTCLDEVGAAGTALTWAHAGDIVVLPIHDRTARAQVVNMLDRLFAFGWRPGQSFAFI